MAGAGPTAPAWTITGAGRAGHGDVAAVVPVEREPGPVEGEAALLEGREGLGEAADRLEGLVEALEPVVIPAKPSQRITKAVLIR